MVTVTNGREIMALRERRYRELGVPPPEKEDALERWQIKVERANGSQNHSETSC